MFLEEGVSVALGTDVAGGYSPSMLDAMRQSLIASNCCSMEYRDGKKKRRNGFVPLKSSLSMPNLDPPAIVREASTIHGPILRSISFTQRQQTKIRSTSELSLSLLDEEVIQRASTGVTDSDGGVSLSVDETASIITKDYSPLTYKEIFHIATMGGAEVLGMSDVIGNFLPGKKLDCLVVDVARVDGPIDIFGEESILEKFQKFLFLGDDRNILSVYVDGRLVL